MNDSAHANSVCAKILIASRYEKDQRLILSAIPETMEFDIVGIEKDATGTIIRIDRLKPDVLILDLEMSQTISTELLPMIRRRSPSTAIILLCDYYEEDHITLAIRAGISAFLIKENDFNKLVYVIKIAVLGGCYINDSIMKKIVNESRIVNQLPHQMFINKLAEISGNTEYADALYSFFSPLEQTVITKMAQGYSDDKIAKQISYNIGTIRNSILEIKRKINLNTRVEIILFSLLYGLIRLENLTSWFQKADALFKKIVSEGKKGKEKEKLLKK
ncbi:MAG: response regulator transcription factor [Treponema sp.]|nr:response regulator transcription factor [Treponema sp.]MCL2250610.1 response regulator transcription factor [Treponema sp.]